MSRASHARVALTSAGLAAVAHWLTAAHRPATLPDAVHPLAVPLLAQSQVARVLDQLTMAVPVGQDVAVASWLILALTAGVAAAWLARLGLPSAVTIAFSVGLTFLRTPWSTQAAGRDALVLAAAVFLLRTATGTTADTGRTQARLAGIVGLLAIASDPSAVWWIAPLAACLWPLPRAERWMWATVAVVGAASFALTWTSFVRGADGCLAQGTFSSHVWAVLLPGRGTAAAVLSRLTTAWSAVLTNVHVFGLAAAVWALWLVGPRYAELRRVTLAACVVVGCAVAAGALTRESSVMVALALWLPWYALAGHALWVHATGRWRVAGRLAVLAIGGLLAAGRHMVVVPAALAADMVHVRPSLDAAIGTALVAVADVQAARRARLAGHVVAPLDTSTLARCAATPRGLVAQGAAVANLQAAGADLTPVPLSVPLSALARDVRAGSVVAFGATSEAMRWLRPTDAEPLVALGVSRDDIVARRARGVVAGQSRRTVWSPPTVTTTDGDVTIDQGAPPATTLVRSRTAALAIFDPDDTVVLRGTSERSPGLPVRVSSTRPELALARVTGWSDRGQLPRFASPLLPAPDVVDDDTPRAVKVYVGTGWHDAETLGGTTFRWGAATTATAVFTLPHAAALSLDVDAAPAQTSDHPNVLRLLLNGEPLAAPRSGAGAIEIAATRTHAGVNTLTFATETVVPAGSVPGEPRTLSAVVRHLRLVRQ